LLASAATGDNVGTTFTTYVQYTEVGIKISETPSIISVAITKWARYRRSRRKITKKSSRKTAGPCNRVPSESRIAENVECFNLKLARLRIHRPETNMSHCPSFIMTIKGYDMNESRMATQKYTPRRSDLMVNAKAINARANMRM
jgi:hypothetical protein